MKNNPIIIARIAILLLMLSGQSLAESAEDGRLSTSDNEKNAVGNGSADAIRALLSKATKDFSEQNYNAAKQSFLDAKALMEQRDEVAPAIYYNLGSVCYRLEQYEQSRDYFSSLSTNQNYAALAYYNIALNENQLNNRDAAIAALEKSRSETSDNELLALIDRQLKTLQEKDAKAAAAKEIKDWHLFLYARPGYDSNIRFAPLEIASNESGNFVQYIGAFDKSILGSATGQTSPALLLTSTVFISNYFSTDFNDYNMYDAGLRYAFPSGQWKNKIDVNVKKLTYGHEDYQHITSATLRTGIRFANRDELKLRYRYEDISSLRPIYDYLSGYRQRLRAGYQLTFPQDKLQLWYELEFNDRQNMINRNYSPTRNSLRLRYENRLNDTSKLVAEYEYRHSQYDPTPVQDRQDDRSVFLLAYVNDIAKGWQGEARWRFYTNRSTDTVYSYDRHLVFFSIRKLF
jgi:predicted negative regulator of RcsB-dependent stress response